MADVEIGRIEIYADGGGRTAVEHSPEVLAALNAAAAAVCARAKAMSVSGDSDYHYGVDVMPTTAHGYVVTANPPAMNANNRAGNRPLEAAINY